MPRTAVADEEDQAEMFPELNMEEPTHKALLAAAKKLHREKSERDALLSTSKEKVDGCEAKLIAAMHSARIDKFRHRGVKAEIIARTERVEVKVEKENPGNGEDEGED